jgi:hypothetical protein
MAKITRQIGAFLASMIATFLLFWGAADVNHLAHVILPLRQSLRAVRGVESVSIRDVNGETELVVRLAPVPDLMATVEAIRARVSPDVGPYTLDLVYPSDARLEALVQTDTFVVEQGFATGQFVQMEKTLVANGRAAGVTTRVQMDGNDVYLSLFDGHGHYRYAIFAKGGGSP